MTAPTAAGPAFAPSGAILQTKAHCKNDGEDSNVEAINGGCAQKKPADHFETEENML